MLIALDAKPTFTLGQCRMNCALQHYWRNAVREMLLALSPLPSGTNEKMQDHSRVVALPLFAAVS